MGGVEDWEDKVRGVCVAEHDSMVVSGLGESDSSGTVGKSSESCPSGCEYGCILADGQIRTLGRYSACHKASASDF